MRGAAQPEHEPGGADLGGELFEGFQLPLAALGRRGAVEEIPGISLVLAVVLCRNVGVLALPSNPHGVTNHHVKGEIIIAYVIPRPGIDLAPNDILEFCRERLSTYKLPDRIVSSDSLPLTPTGKLMRRELKAMAVEAGKPMPPRT